ncbi:unnamed protein product, partial [Prorocentrum cordatum]
LEVVAFMVSIDISKIEARNASIRRICKYKSLQTHSIKFEDLSSQFLMLRQRRSRQCVWYAKTQHSTRPGSNPQVDLKKKVGRKRRARPGNSGGPWRAFVHTRWHEAPAGAKPTFRQLGEQYRALTPEEMNVFIELGHLARLAALNGVKPFGDARRKTAVRGHLESVPVCDSDHQPGQDVLLPTGLTFEEMLEQEMTKATLHRQVEIERGRTADAALARYVQEARDERSPTMEFAKQYNLDLYQMPVRDAEIPKADVSVPESMASSLFDAPAQYRLQSQLVTDWQGKHRCISNSDLPKATVPKDKQVCFQAGRCICGGDGYAVARLRKQILKAMSGAFVSSELKLLLLRG